MEPITPKQKNPITPPIPSKRKNPSWGIVFIVIATWVIIACNSDGQDKQPATNAIVDTATTTKNDSLPPHPVIYSILPSASQFYKTYNEFTKEAGFNLLIDNRKLSTKSNGQHFVFASYEFSKELLLTVVINKYDSSVNRLMLIYGNNITDDDKIKVLSIVHPLIYITAPSIEKDRVKMIEEMLYLFQRYDPALPENAENKLYHNNIEYLSKKTENQPSMFVIKPEGSPF